MNRLFSMDNIVMQTLGKIFDLVLLNIIFIISCIPVFTIGTSLSSLYTVTLNIVRKKDPYIIKGFFDAFRSNFRQSTILWIFCLIMICFLGYDYQILNAQGSGVSMIRLLLILITLILCAIFLYLFPVVSHFNCPTKKAVQNALLLSIAHLPWTLLLFLYYGTILYLLLHFPQILGLFTLIGMFCGFSISALITSLIYNHIFQNYE